MPESKLREMTAHQLSMFTSKRNEIADLIYLAMLREHTESRLRRDPNMTNGELKRVSSELADTILKRLDRSDLIPSVFHPCIGCHTAEWCTDNNRCKLRD